ncbi:MAG: hypothetical protein GEU81_00880 [Nitriliruptorales bacterium]|nr:hypothetical protein [Nitriliruptorales bacterium]
MDFIGEFFRAVPEALVALWDFADGFRGLAVMLGSAALAVVFGLIALQLRHRSGWLGSIFGMMSVTIVMWWLFGILPSAWVYFADGQQEVLGGRIIPESLPLMDNFYELFRDLVVATETGIAIGLVVVAAFWIQKRYPRSLAEGEEARPQSGGYR